MTIDNVRTMLLNKLGPAAEAGYQEARMYYTELLFCSDEEVLDIFYKLSSEQMFGAEEEFK